MLFESGDSIGIAWLELSRLHQSMDQREMWLESSHNSSCTLNVRTFRTAELFFCGVCNHHSVNCNMLQCKFYIIDSIISIRRMMTTPPPRSIAWLLRHTIPIIATQFSPLHLILWQYCIFRTNDLDVMHVITHGDMEIIRVCCWEVPFHFAHMAFNILTFPLFVRFHGCTTCLRYPGPSLTVYLCCQQRSTSTS